MSRENVETIGRFYDAMARRDLAGAIEFFDPNAVLINTPNSPETAPYIGHDGLLEWVRNAQEGVRDLRVEADETVEVDDSRVLVVGRVCGEGPVSGLPVEIALTTVYTLRDGKIVRAEAYDTKPQALEAVGLRE
jgi:ketosteroid isomerase-like protein